MAREHASRGRTQSNSYFQITIKTDTALKLEESARRINKTYHAGEKLSENCSHCSHKKEELENVTVGEKIQDFLEIEIE